MTKYSFILFIFLFLLNSCEDQKELPKSEGKINFTKVDYHVIKTEPVQQIITVPGRTMPFEQVNIYSEISARVQRILFKEGDIVKNGEVLVQMDTDILQAQKKQLEVELDLAEKDLKRKKQLYENQAGTLEALEKAQSNVANLEAQINLKNVQISKGTIRAPFSGKVGLRLISEGAYLSPADKITSLAKIDQLKISFAVAQRYASLVKIGQEISFVPPTDSLDKDPLKAKVYATEPIIDESTQMLTVRAKMDQSNRIMPGGFVKIRYNLGTAENSIMIPTTAIAPVIDGQVIWKFQNGQAKKVKINLGVRKESEIQIYGDVSSGDTIAVTGLLGMEEGKNIKPKNEVK